MAAGPVNVPFNDSKVPVGGNDFTKNPTIGTPVGGQPNTPVPVSAPCVPSTAGMRPGGPMPFANNPRVQPAKPWK